MVTSAEGYGYCSCASDLTVFRNDSIVECVESNRAWDGFAQGPLAKTLLLGVTVEVIRSEDDKFHPRGDSPYWNESAAFIFMVPERRLSGFVYLYYRPNMNLSAGGAALWDSSGEEIYDCLYHEFNEHMPFPAGAEMFECTLPNALTFDTIELLKSYRMVFKGNKGLEFDLIWEGIMPPHEVALGEPGKVDLAEWGARHYEQAGRMRGTLNLEGETLEVDSWSLRDRTWGPREPDRAPRAAWPWAIASETSSFQVAAVSDLPPDENPIAGTTERVMYGWYTKDGVLGDLVSGERRVVERGEDGRPIREVIDATDHLGRTLHAEGVCQNWLKWPNYVDWFDWWSLCRWEFDGQVAWGEAHDYYSFRQSRRFLRSLRKSQDIARTPR